MNVEPGAMAGGEHARGAGLPRLEEALLEASRAGERLARRALEGASAPELTRLLEAALLPGLPRLAVAREALRSGSLLELPPERALAQLLELLLALTGAEAASLWHAPHGSALAEIAHAGDLEPLLRPTRELARELLRAEAASADDKTSSHARTPPELTGFHLASAQAAPAALVLRVDAGSQTEVSAVVGAATAMLIALLEREQRARDAEVSVGDVLRATERRLQRVRFDLHDGPQQDLLMLAEDLGLFRAQLQSVIEGQPDARRVLGRVDDLQARLVALDGDIRRIAGIFQSPFLQQESLSDALADLTDAFSARTGIEPQVEITGAQTPLTDAQHITLLSLVREALNNIRQHSDAEHVAVKIALDPDMVHVTITDDGCGFEPETTLMRTAREGHLGLVGMHERVRMLGGHTQIQSRPGGPTTISATVPQAPDSVPRRA